MPKVSVIGAGPAGLIFAYALLREGYDVTVYSDRTPDHWLNNGPPTGTAYLYGEVIDIEKQLGMDFWADDMHQGHGVHLDFKPALTSDMKIEASGRFKTTGGAIDQRLRVHRWLLDLENKGGKLVIEAVTPQRLDEVAAQSDLTVLAAGKADLGSIIPRDSGKSIYDKPQRFLSMCIVDGVKGWSDRVDFTPVKFNFFADAGEFFWVPYTHKSGVKNWCVLFEAKAGGAFDIFRTCTNAQDVATAAKHLIHTFAPWDWEVCKDMTPVDGDPYCWLKGAFPPTVRQAFGRLPSGGLVMPIGDTAITFDPIGGQGGNNAGRNAKFVADAVIAHGDAAFDELWMQAVHDDFWDYHGKWAYSFNNILLEPLTAAGQIALAETARNRVFADEQFFGNFSTPRGFFPWIEDQVAAQDVVDRYRTADTAA